MLIKDSSIEDKLNMNELDKEAEELEKVFEWFKFSNCICLYLAYIGNGLLKLGFSSCGLIDREKKHMSSESEFEQFRVIKAYKISSGKIETIIKDLLVRYRVKFNKQFEIYKPNKSLQEFCEMTETLLLDNDLKYQLDIALKRAEDAEKKVVELERQLNKM